MPRHLNAFLHLSLDGYYCDARGDMTFAHKAPTDAEWNDWVAGNAQGGGDLLFGRVTYDMMAAWWPSPMAAQMMPDVATGMNAATKFVASRTMTTAGWANTTVLAGDLVDAVRALKATPGPPITILGSGSIVAQLARARLLDGLQVVINPVALGAGRALFSAAPDGGPVPFRLTKSRTFGNGAVVLWYDAI